MKTSHLVATLLVTFKASRTRPLQRRVAADVPPGKVGERRVPRRRRVRSGTSKLGRYYERPHQLLTVVALYKALGGGWKLTDEAWTGVR